MNDWKPIAVPSDASMKTVLEVIDSGRMQIALVVDGGSFFPPAAAALPMDAVSSLDIDDAIDWAMAEALQDLSWRAKKHRRVGIAHQAAFVIATRGGQCPPYLLRGLI